MSVQAALAFLHDVRRDDALRARVRATPDLTAETLVALGRSAGREFTGEEMHQAHALDWRMRWARYGGTEPSRPAG